MVKDTRCNTHKSTKNENKLKRKEQSESDDSEDEDDFEKINSSDEGDESDISEEEVEPRKNKPKYTSRKMVQSDDEDDDKYRKPKKIHSHKKHDTKNHVAGIFQ